MERQTLSYKKLNPESKNPQEIKRWESVIPYLNSTSNWLGIGFSVALWSGEPQYFDARKQYESDEFLEFSAWPLPLFQKYINVTSIALAVVYGVAGPGHGPIIWLSDNDSLRDPNKGIADRTYEMLMGMFDVHGLSIPESPIAAGELFDELSDKDLLALPDLMAGPLCDFANAERTQYGGINLDDNSPPKNLTKKTIELLQLYRPAPRMMQAYAIVLEPSVTGWNLTFPFFPAEEDVKSRGWNSVN